MMIDLPPTLRFNRDTVYTFIKGPNAGRALKYIGPGEKPFQDHVHVATADGFPFRTKHATHSTETKAVCLPQFLVVK